MKFYALVWGVANSLLLSSNLIFFRLHHLGDASWLFTSFLVLAALIIGGIFGALNWAAYVLLIDRGKVVPRNESTKRLAFQLGVGLSGFIGLGLLNGIFANGNHWQFLLLAVAVFSAVFATSRLGRSSVAS